jgi:hypothetical protein
MKEQVKGAGAFFFIDNPRDRTAWAHRKAWNRRARCAAAARLRVEALEAPSMGVDHDDDVVVADEVDDKC